MKMNHHPALNILAFSATMHCFTGCAIGEVIGMIAGTAFGLSNITTIILAIIFAFVFGYTLTLLPLVKSGMALTAALGLAFASDTVSIAVMEVADNIVMYFIPGAMNTHLGDPLFWGSLAISLVFAIVAAFPVNRWLISKGKGHAIVHAHHDHR